MRSLRPIPLFLAAFSGCGEPEAVGPAMGTARSSSPRVDSRPLPEWDAAFRRRDSGWRGADAAYSVQLAPRRTLWLFGDTWITEPKAPHREGARMIRNSLAIQTISGRRPESPVFFWRDAGGKPADAFAPVSGPGWLWPLSGLHGGGRLFLFMSQLVATQKGFGFASHRSVLVTVLNPDDAPRNWDIEQVEVPYFRRTEQGDFLFGAANLVEDSDAYVFGIREDWTKSVGGRSVLVARVPLEALRARDFSAWRFFAGDRWSERPDDTASLFDGAATEMSVSRFPGEDRLTAVYTPNGLSPEIHVRFAPRPEGPWSEPALVHRVPDLARNAKYFAYAAKAHPELADAPGELVITYAVNSMDLGDHFRDAELYWPRFIRVKLGGGR